MKLKIRITTIILSSVFFGGWWYLGRPIPAWMNRSFLPREAVIARNTNFYPGDDFRACVAAWASLQLYQDIKGVCGDGRVKCDKDEVLTAGTHVRLIKIEWLTNSSGLEIAFAEVQLDDGVGWVAADAVQ
ncbi:MAG: hypothetical protein JO061_15040 [Acidobacteriaceae bacterium]|nr:hypothetical protein [Acidobacteriaceae bacterium]